MTDWIPVGERLPPTGERVLITFQRRKGKYKHIKVVCVMFDSTGHCDIDTRFSPIHVLAWMPLPEPYQPPS